MPSLKEIKKEWRKLKMDNVQKARQLLKDNGYAIDYCWHIDDVKYCISQLKDEYDEEEKDISVLDNFSDKELFDILESDWLTKGVNDAIMDELDRYVEDK